MPKLTAIAPPQDRVQVYPDNPFYIQYGGEPRFLFGCNQGWTASLQNLDHDYAAEFDRLAEVGGNLVRITPFICPKVDAPDRFDDRANNLPWRREGDQYHLDLDRDGGNPHFWDRLASLVRCAYDREIIISFEFWDLYGPARGPGGNLDFQTPPGDRWSAHPFFPGNSPDLTGVDALPAQTHMRDIAFCRTVTRGAYGKALRLQEQYVRRLLDVLSPYPNVIYCMVNETSAEKAWSDYWLDFTHRYFDEVWDGAPHLAGEMPREYGFTGNFTVEDMLDDARYDFADASQYYRGSGLAEAQRVQRNLARFRAYGERSGHVKPLMCMKVYNRLAPSVLWMRLLAGSASARYHRVLGSNWQPDEAIADLAARQLGYVSHMATFLRERAFRPWAMRPDPEVVIAAENVDATLAMCAADRTICAVLVYNEVQRGQREITLALPGAPAAALWLDPATGEQVAATPTAGDGQPGLTWRAPPSFGQAVLICQTS
jgi:hypothetical protein